MTYSVYQHWDPLKVCIVGRSYPPEFYSWITVPHVRSLFERIATETEEDFQNIIKKLQEFDVEILRPNLPVNIIDDNKKFIAPPMTPRDWMVMSGNIFYTNTEFNLTMSYNNVRAQHWPIIQQQEDFFALPDLIKKECINQFEFNLNYSTCYKDILKQISAQGNQIRHHVNSSVVNGAMMSRIGKDLYFGTIDYNQNIDKLQQDLNAEFVHTRNHIVDTGGHSDGTYCPVCPGLIISLMDVPTYADTFPGWEVVYLPKQSWGQVSEFMTLKQQNKGRWWIPGFEHDQDVVNVVETWLGHWTGYVEETVFDVNMLVIDPKNVMVFNYNKQVFDALERYGITPHIVPFRHRYFWDGGIHCVTSDLHREGVMQDYFPERSV